MSREEGEGRSEETAAAAFLIRYAQPGVGVPLPTLKKEGSIVQADHVGVGRRLTE